MQREKLAKYLNEEYATEFKGWDFSHLKGRMVEEIYPWSYLEK